VINLFKDVGLALKDSGGAASSFQTALRDLSIISNILSHLEGLKANHSAVSEANAIRALAQQAQYQVQLFLDKVEKYKDTLGNRAPKGFHHGTLSKIKWAQFVQNQVEKLQLNVHYQMRNITLLLELLNQRVQEESQIIILKEMTRYATSLDQVSAHVDSVQAVLGQDIKFARGQISQSLQDLGQDLTDSTMAANKRMVAQYWDGHAQLSAQLSDLSTNLSTTVAQHGQSMTNLLQQAQPQTTTSDDVREIKQLLVSLHETCQKSSASPVMSNAHCITLALTILRLGLSLSDIRDLLGRYFNNQDETLVQVLLASFLTLLRDFFWALPQLILVVKFMRCLPRSVSCLLSDNMRFEDALGRVQSLQFQQFRNWAVFEANLRCTFEDHPGYRKVVRGHFILTSPNYPGRRLNASNWGECASRRILVVMSISMRTILPEKGDCPRGCGSRTSSISATESRCLDCNLFFSSETETGIYVHDQTSRRLHNYPRKKREQIMALEQRVLEEKRNRLDEIKEIKIFKRVYFDIDSIRNTVGGGLVVICSECHAQFTGPDRARNLKRHREFICIGT
jgi:hypothetical protein